MPETLNRAWEWFRARSTAQKVLIVIAAVLVVGALSRVVAYIAGLVFVAALVALVVQLVRRRPVRAWAIIAGVALVVGLVFGGLSSAIYGPETADQAGVNRAEEPEVREQPEQPRQERQEEEPAEEQAEPQQPDYSGQLVLLQIRPSGNAAYGTTIKLPTGTQTIAATQEFQTYRFNVESASITVERLTDHGNVDVSLLDDNGKVLERHVADDRDDTVNIVWGG